MIRGFIVRRFYKRLKVQRKITELGQFNYGDRPKGTDPHVIIKNETQLGNGDVYTGEWRRKTHIREGKGKLLKKDGSVYEGWWKDDMQNGPGRFINARDETVFVGNWQDGSMHGEGKYTWKDGNIYHGFFEQNNIHGKGKYESADGRVYEGNWVDN